MEATGGKQKGMYASRWELRKEKKTGETVKYYNERHRNNSKLKTTLS